MIYLEDLNEKLQKRLEQGADLEGHDLDQSGCGDVCWVYFLDDGRCIFRHVYNGTDTFIEVFSKAEWHTRDRVIEMLRNRGYEA